MCMIDHITDRYGAEVITAWKEYKNRQDRTLHPDGWFGKADRWFPYKAERKPCCERINPPTRDRPYSLMLHCRTIKHIAALYNVPASKLRGAAQMLAHCQ